MAVATQRISRIDHQPIDEFTQQVLLLIRSSVHHEMIVEGLSRILPLERDQLARNSVFLFDVACAKLVLECSILTHEDSDIRVTDLQYGEQVKEACFRKFALNYRRLADSQKLVEESAIVPLSYLHLYDDASAAFSTEGVGRLLSSRLLRRANSSTISLGPDAMTRLISFIDYYGFHHYWERLRSDSDILWSMESSG